jgi:hypothetical protein
MTQRSLHAVTNVYYRSMSCFATVSRQTVPASSAKVSCTKRHLLHHVVQAVHKVCHKDRSQSMVPSPLNRARHTAYSIPISKQVVPYLTRGGTCCLGVSTRKILPLADSSMTNHITWQNPTVSTIPSLLKPQHQSSPWSNHISTGGRPSLTKTQAKLNITKDGRTCTTLMTGWLSINPNPKVWGVGNSIKACRPMCILDREREHIGSIWSRVTYLALPLVAAQSLECRAPRDSQILRLLTVAIGNKQHNQINKQYTFSAY